MSAYQQMGHNSDNLLHDPDLTAYKGVILSPVNHDVAALIDKTRRASLFRQFDTIFDPQLYVPKAARGQLTTWGYYPSDLDSSDLAAGSWWRNLTDKVIGACDAMKPDAICSPAQVPAREFSPDYFASTVDTGTYLHKQLATNTRTRAIQTAIVQLNYLAAAPDRPLQTASILSKSPCEEIYLVLDNNTKPRLEFSDWEQILGAMRLIRALEDAGHRVTVAFACADMVLWKAAGASHCGTGKFFNLRRFTSTRFEPEEAKGGSQIPYFFEEGLFAFLRAADVVNIRAAAPDILAQTIKTNPLAQEFIDAMADPEKSQLNVGWRQYLRWFVTAEQRIESGELALPAALAAAARNWETVKGKHIVIAEPKNDGSWLPAWSKALDAFLKERQAE